MRILKAIRDLEMLRGCGVSVWLGCVGSLDCPKLPNLMSIKKLGVVVLLLFENLKGDFEGSETAKCQFGGLGRHCETWRVVLDSPRPWIWAHCETSGCKLERAETWHLCTWETWSVQSWYLRNFGVYFVVWVWCVHWFPFLPFQCVQPFRHSCILVTFVGAKELKRGCYLRYVYIFRFVVGGGRGLTM